jgi:hypothetical protein
MIPLKGIRRITLLTVLGRIHSDIVRIWNIRVSLDLVSKSLIIDASSQDPDGVISPNFETKHPLRRHDP